MNEPLYTVEEIEELKDNTEIGQFIRFDRRGLGSEMGPMANEVETVNGFVKEKYAHTFMLDDEKVYRWADYLIGRVY